MSNGNDELELLPSGLTNIQVGKNVRIVSPSNVYGCILSDDVFVGPFTEIQEDVVVGPRTRIQSHSFICSRVSIGEDCFIGHGVMFVNDKLIGGPARGDKSKWLSTAIGNRVSIGSNSTILPVKICDDVVVGAGSVVTRNINAPGVYAGNPARLLRDEGTP